MSNYFSNASQNFGNQQVAAGQQQQGALNAQQSQQGQNAQSYQNYALGTASGNSGGGGVQQSYTDPATGQTTLNGVSPLTAAQQESMYAQPGAAYGAQGQGAGAAYGQQGQAVAQQGMAGYQGIAAYGANAGANILGTNSAQMGTAQGTTAGAVDPAALGLSQNYQQNYQMTPTEIQGLANQAGRTVGQSFNAQSNAAQLQADAGGQSAMGMNALENRVGVQSAAAAGGAMADARLNAQLANLGVIQNAESTRLGAQQALTQDQLAQGAQQGSLASSQAATGLGVGGFEAGIGQNAVAQEAQLGQQGATDQFTGSVTGAQMGLTGAQQAQAGQQAGYTQGMGANQTLSQQASTLANLYQSGQMSYQQYQLQSQQLMSQLYGQTTSAGQGGLQAAYGQQGPTALQTGLSILGAASGAALNGAKTAALA